MVIKELMERESGRRIGCDEILKKKQVGIRVEEIRVKEIMEAVKLKTLKVNEVEDQVNKLGDNNL